MRTEMAPRGVMTAARPVASPMRISERGISMRISSAPKIKRSLSLGEFRVPAMPQVGEGPVRDYNAITTVPFIPPDLDVRRSLAPVVDPKPVSPRVVSASTFGEFKFKPPVEVTDRMVDNGSREAQVLRHSEGTPADKDTKISKEVQEKAKASDVKQAERVLVALDTMKPQLSQEQQAKIKSNVEATLQPKPPEIIPEIPTQILPKKQMAEEKVVEEILKSGVEHTKEKLKTHVTLGMVEQAIRELQVTVQTKTLPKKIVVPEPIAKDKEETKQQVIYYLVDLVEKKKKKEKVDAKEEEQTKMKFVIDQKAKFIRYMMAVKASFVLLINPFGQQNDDDGFSGEEFANQLAPSENAISGAAQKLGTEDKTWNVWLAKIKTVAKTSLWNLMGIAFGAIDQAPPVDLQNAQQAKGEKPAPENAIAMVLGLSRNDVELAA